MKILWHIIKWLLFSIIGIIILILIFLLLDRDARSVTMTDADRANIKATEAYNSEVDSVTFKQLLATYGKNKNLAPGFEYQCLLALSHYPELKEAPIDFLLQPAFLPLASRPEPLGILFPWKKRRYNVIISNASEDFFEPILLKNLPFNTQVGIIGHELAHTVYYQDKTALQFIGIAYNYQYDNDYHDDFERDTDKRAVAHGLGYQLYDFAFFVRKSFGMTKEEIDTEEGDTYLSPSELIAEMAQYDFYQDSLATRNIRWKHFPEEKPVAVPDSLSTIPTEE